MSTPRKAHIQPEIPIPDRWQLAAIEDLDEEQETSFVRFASSDIFSAINDSTVKPRTRATAVRTLKEPPDIWDLVHETPTKFKPGSAFVGHVTSRRSLALITILLVVGAGAAVWYTTQRGLWAKKATTSAVPAERNRLQTLSRAPSNLATEPATVSNQQPADSTARKDASATEATATTPSATDIKSPDSTINDQKPSLAPSDALPAIPVAAKLRRQTLRNSAAANSALTRRNKDQIQPTTTVAPKSENDKGANSTAAKKDTDKPSDAPAKATTPKAKVIPWP